MRNLDKSRKEDEDEDEDEDKGVDDSSPFSRLPDEIILQILNKLIDFKTLCCCYLVSRRFSSILLQVDAISLTAAHIADKDTPITPFLSIAFLSAYRFLNKFKGVKSLRIELPSYSEIGIDNPRCLFKWKVKFGNRIESLMFLSPNSLCDKDGFDLNGNRDGEEDMGLTNDSLNQKIDTSIQCLSDAMVWHVMLLSFVKNLPKLEEVSITDSGRRGRLSMSGGKLSLVKEWSHSSFETEFDGVEIPYFASYCYIPVLKLPVSGYVMKGIYFGVMEMKDLHGGNDGLMNSEEDGFEDKEEAAYTEAMVEILEKHRGMMLSLPMVL